MARDTLRVWLALDRIHCSDEGDGWGSAEPYLWTVFFKIDGETVALTESLKLSGTATVIGTPGSHGNLGDSDVDAGDDVTIPDAIGEWSPFLSPIPVPESLQPLVGDDLPGVVGVVCVLMEEDNVTDDGAEAGHAALNSAVMGALTDIIATRGFSNPDISQQDIAAYMDAVASAVADAVASQQNFFENIWSWLNEDDTVGTRVFFWTHDDLAGGDTNTFSQRWQNEGDWEIFGHVNATVVCPAEAAAATAELPDGMITRVERQMRAFRDREFGGTELPQWWALAERNSPQLVYAMHQDARVKKSYAALLRGVPTVLEDRDAPLTEELLDHARHVVQGLKESGSRRSRIDASRILDVLQHVHGKTGAQAIELIGSIRPGRTPRPVRDIGHLLNPGLRVPPSVFQPVDPSEGRRSGPTRR